MNDSSPDLNGTSPSAESDPPPPSNASLARQLTGIEKGVGELREAYKALHGAVHGDKAKKIAAVAAVGLALDHFQRALGDWTEHPQNLATMAVVLLVVFFVARSKPAAPPLPPSAPSAPPPTNPPSA